MKNLLLRLGILGIGFIIGGIVILAGNAADKKSIAKGVGDINNMSITDFAAGDFVEGDIGILCDEFAYLSEYNSTFGIKSNERVSKHYYVVPLVGNTSEYDQFIAIEVGNEDMVSIAETMIDEFWSYAEDNDVSKLVTTMPFRGKVVKMEDELSDYMYEWFTYLYSDVTKDDMATLTCPYVIEYTAPGSEQRGATGGVVILLLGVLFTGIAAAVFVKTRKDAAASAVGDMPYGSPDAVERETYSPAVTTDESGNINAYQPVNSSTEQSAAEDSPVDKPWEK